MHYMGVAMEGLYIALIVRNLLFCSWIVSAILASYKKLLLMHRYRRIKVIATCLMNVVNHIVYN